MDSIKKELVLEKEKRIIAISDIHTDLESFKLLLKKVRYDEKEDYLFIVGDFLEKSCDNLDKLHYIMDLSKSDNCYVLKGNCDALFQEFYENRNEGYLDYIKQNRQSLFYELCQKENIDLNENISLDELMTLLKSKYEKEYNFLSSLPSIIETEEYVFTHAGKIEKEPISSIDFLRTQSYLEKASRQAKITIVGHWPTVNYSKKYLDYKPRLHYPKNIFSIDGGIGVKGYGQLNAIIIHKNNVDIFYIDKLRKAKVIDEHLVSEHDSFAITYPNNEVIIKDDLGEFKLCESVSLNKTLKIPSTFIKEVNGRFYTADTTNYKHTLHVGDTVGICYKTKKYALVKFNGVVGWVNKKCLED